MKKRLLLLSDLWGFDQADYLNLYSKQLESVFAVKSYDSCVLANLPADGQSQEQRHQHFVSGGIEAAVDQLMGVEEEEVAILAFSVGGTIAWRAALSGLPVDQLFAISATRLRYEKDRPACGLQLWYGGLDPYQPNAEWYEKMQLSAFQWPGHGHDIYKNVNVIQAICQQLLTS